MESYLPWVDTRGVTAFGFIALVEDSVGQRLSECVDPQPNDLIATHCRYCLNNVAVLAWKVLVYEEEAHHAKSLGLACF